MALRKVLVEVEYDEAELEGLDIESLLEDAFYGEHPTAVKMARLVLDDAVIHVVVKDRY